MHLCALGRVRLCRSKPVRYLNLMLQARAPQLQTARCPLAAFAPCRCEHGVILKVVATNICGSDQHMVRGRTTAPSGLVLGHEITGEVVEVGRDVEVSDAEDAAAAGWPGPVMRRPHTSLSSRCCFCISLLRPRLQFVKKGDLVSTPFNIACGRCRNCKEGNTGICLNVNPARPGETLLLCAFLPGSFDFRNSRIR